MRSSSVYVLAILAALAGFTPVWVGAQSGKSSTPTVSQKTSGGSSDSDEDGGFCIAQDIRSKLSQECSGAGAIGKGGKLGKSQAPKTRFQEVSRRKKLKVEEDPKGPAVQIDAADLVKRKKFQSRERAFLNKEVKILKRQVKNRRTGDPQRPKILLRLAETYFELQRTANAKVRSYDEKIFSAREAGKKDLVKKFKSAQKKSEKDVKKFSVAMVKTYSILVRDHDDFGRMDEVLFALGFTLDQLDKKDKARQAYQLLIKDYPQSEYVPTAYLSFAEAYFQKGEMADAARLYDKVLDIPPSRNPVYGYALYKQAWCAYNLEDFKSSLRKFVEVIEFGLENRDATDVKNLVKQSRRELVMPYAMVGNPKKSFDFFKKYAKDETQAFQLLENLAELYFDTGNWNATVTVYHDLMDRKPEDAQLCYWQTRVTNAVLARNKKKAAVTEVERMIDVWEAFTAGTHGDDVKKVCKQSAASVLVELATAWHREAIGTDTQPGTNDRKTMKLSSKLYRLLLDRFPDMEAMEFKDIDKRDWPTEYKISYFYAELLWKMENWAQCAPAFDKVVELKPDGQFTADAALAAVLCYNNIYQQSFAAGERDTSRSKKRGKKKGKKKSKGAEEDLMAKFAPRELGSVEKGMLDAFTRYVCYVKDGEDLPTMKYRRARIYYESNQFEEAALLFEDIAVNHSDSDLAEYAANLYLDSLNSLGSYREPKRTECFDEIEAAVPKLIGLYCQNDERREEFDTLCPVLEQLRCDILRKKAETLQSTGEYKKAARTYVKIYKKYQECGRLDEVLYNAAINYETANLIGRAIRARKVLMEKYPSKPLAKRALYLIGSNYLALAFYDDAAKYYEQFAEKYPGESGKSCSDSDIEEGLCPVAHEALQQAVFFRLGLGDDEKAIADAKLFSKNYKKRKPRQASQVFYALAAIYERDNDWKGVAKHYREYLKRFRRQSMPHEQIRANVQIGRAMWELDRKKDAERSFKAAIKLWSAGAAGKIDKLKESDKARKKFLAEAKQATAEALWYMGEYKFAEFKLVKFPDFKFKGKKANLERVNEWSTGPFVKWIETKSGALNAALESYGKVRDIKAPMWDIAAASRVGLMYREFVDDFRDAPIPTEIKKDQELWDIYEGALDEKSQPWVVKATGAFEQCLQLATQVRWFNEHSKRCELELNKLDARRFPMGSELRGRPRYKKTARPRPTPVEIGGQEADNPTASGDAEGATDAQ